MTCSYLSDSGGQALAHKKKKKCKLKLINHGKVAQYTTYKQKNIYFLVDLVEMSHDDGKKIEKLLKNENHLNYSIRSTDNALL